MEKTAKILSRLLCGVITAAGMMIVSFHALLPAEISACAEMTEGGFHYAKIIRQNDSLTYFVGPVPIKAVTADITDRKYLIPCGTPFGIKLRTEGVIAVSVTKGSPAEKSGVKQGDVIISVNGQQVTCNTDIMNAVQLSPEECELILRRGDSEKHLTMQPYSECGVYRIGVWVRDSAAGIGTMSYYDPDTGIYGGLGHPVSDVTTGGLMPLASGEITGADISGVIRGEAGAPGELCGSIDSSNILGTIEQNTRCGIFGTAEECPSPAPPVPVAFRQEVSTGAAVILTTTDGSTPKEYDIEIEHISLVDMESSKSMVIRITDEELLNRTGGIVCGMSGSPIIQNGMLVGAVTHVFLNDPERGYAVFCETMLEQAS